MKRLLRCFALLRILAVMILLPLPILLAMILGVLALRRGLRPVPLLAALALQAMINALSLHYGMSAARFVPPISAMCVPTLANGRLRATGVR